MWLGVGGEEDVKWKLSPFAWYDRYKRMVSQGCLTEEDVKSLKESALALMNSVRSDHAPLCAEIGIDFPDCQPLSSLV